MKNFPLYRTPELDLADRIRWLVRDAENISFEFANNGSHLNVNLLNNLQKMIDNIKINMEIVNTP